MSTIDIYSPSQPMPTEVTTNPPLETCRRCPERYATPCAASQRGAGGEMVHWVRWALLANWVKLLTNMNQPMVT